MPGAEAEPKVFSFGEFMLDDRRAALYRDGVAVTLRPKCYEVLRLLVMNAGRLVTRDELLDSVWRDLVVTEGSVAQCIAEIRRALGDTQQTVIRTVPRRGFVFEIPVSEALPDEPVKSSIARRMWIPWLAGVALLAAAAWWMLDHKESGTPEAPDLVVPPPHGSIAVLRFADMSPEDDQAYFADGLAEEILSLLAQSPDLRVTARTSSFAFAPGEASIATIARELGVAYVLEGSVRRDANLVRVTVQLIDARNSTHVWSNSYDRKFESILQLQQEIASDVAGALKIALVPSYRETTLAQARSHDLFLLGRYLFHRRASGDLKKAERHLERAVELDPDNAAAWTALAGTYNVRGVDELGDPMYRIEDQRRALERALAIDPSLAEAHVRLSRYHVMTGNIVAARASHERACELAPHDPLVLSLRSVIAAVDGRFDDALELERQGVAVNPLSSLYRWNFGRKLLGAGRLEEGLAQLYRARELSDRVDMSGPIATALLLLGRIDEARAELARLPPGPERDKLVVMMAPESEAQAALARLESDDSPEGRLRRAEIAAYRNDPETAFRELEAIVSEHSEMDRTDPDFGIWHFTDLSALIGTLRSDPRWPGLVDRVMRHISIDPVAAESGDAADSRKSACSAPVLGDTRGVQGDGKPR